MLVQIDFESEMPIYEQLRRQIIEGIASGNLKLGESLPSVRQLAEDIGINLHTVNKAYNALKSDGYLNVDRRTGAVVSGTFPESTEEFDKKLKEEFIYLICEAHLRGKKMEDILSLCSDIFKQYIKKDK
ncbi:GntR family transcriptional regulator [Clostridium sp. AWRP]|uniref:GntR family transcriptional regulator n=1 Tax=Clostridium sp. AWRP TaxID=2212991 RepID=UPI000FDBD384|nr:GntR family transcriptional regulator [Clostridium sp. AWRP]AZV55467.1 GntR family transcriptional regulator [Clostridium sp. AWRP]